MIAAPKTGMNATMKKTVSGLDPTAQPKPRTSGSVARRDAVRKIANQAIFYAVLIGAWALLAKLRVWPPYLFPPPWNVAEALWAGFQDHTFGGSRKCHSSYR